MVKERKELIYDCIKDIRLYLRHKF